MRSSIRAIIIINNLSSTIFAHVISLHRMVIVIKVNNRDILFLILRVLFFEESLTQDARDIFHETAASFPSWLATFELVSMVSRYSLWGRSEKFQLTHICINLCGRHGCPAQSGNT